MEHTRDHKLDLIKATCISLIFFYHIPPLRFVNPETSPILNLLDSLLSLFIYNVTLLGVPSFFLISLVLFYQKKTVEIQYERKRIRRLLALYVFWTAVQIGLYGLIFQEFPQVDFELIRSGGPKLPFVGDSVFYFLFNLVVLTLLAIGFLACSEKFKVTAAVFVFSISFLIFEITAFTSIVISSHADLLNFIYIVPLSYLIIKKQSLLVRHKYKIFWVYILFVLHDFAIWKFFDFNWPIYGRNSVAFGTLTLFCFMMDCRYRYRRGVAIIGKYSLGIFAVHKYAELAANTFLKNYVPSNVSVSGLDGKALLIFLVSAIFTFFGLYFLKALHLKRWVS